MATIMDRQETANKLWKTGEDRNFAAANGQKPARAGSSKSPQKNSKTGCLIEMRKTGTYRILLISNQQSYKFTGTGFGSPDLYMWPCATLDRSGALTNDYRVQHRAIQNRPYLGKFEAPEALDRCIQILVSRRIFLAIVRNRPGSGYAPQNQPIHLVCNLDVLGLQFLRRC